ncbi:MAG TPA: hypothetical protein ENI79_02010 [Rhodospirillales bacterium]|nr:hypothetical protein [Rhodospirillales bacterium]
MALALGLLVLGSGVFTDAVQASGDDGLAADYWSRPLAPQGDAPRKWSESERSLAPESCGECHEKQFQEWKSSLHAKAFSPGLVGQLMTSFSGSPEICMRCHAPLAEQIKAFKEALAAKQGQNPKAQGLAAKGNSCAGCHVRNHVRFGPPKSDTGETGQSDTEGPHGGVLRTADFEKSEFCGACHQFPPSWGAVNGKPLENTHNEWKASPQAKKGISCQSCHMPKRKHLWRGIHDPKMVKSGLTANFPLDSGKARFQLTNTGVGHAFPTYVTPKVVMRAVALGGDGRPIKGTEVTYVIQRSVDSTQQGWVENFDTRLFPGQSATLDLVWGKARKARMWLEVFPDDFYDHKVYDDLLNSLGGEARKLIAKADAEAQKSRFILFETEVRRPE